MEKEFYTTEDVADILQISPRQARALFRSEGFKGFKLGNSYRIKVSDFNEWVEQARAAGGYNIQSNVY